MEQSDSKKTIVISDFDGTITSDILDDKIHEYLSSREDANKLIKKLNDRTITISEYMTHICDKITKHICDVNGNIDYITLNKFIHEVLDNYNITVDYDAKELERICEINKIPFYILSGGMDKIIMEVYSSQKKDIKNIISHNLEIINGTVAFKCNDFINPKGKYIEENFPKDKFNVIFIGDGVSDFSVIGKCILLFAKKGSILERKCIRENIEHLTFETFTEVINILIEKKYLNGT